MKQINYISDLESLVFDNISLLEIAKGYCEFNQDESNYLPSMVTMLDMIIKNQKDIAKKLDLFSI